MSTDKKHKPVEQPRKQGSLQTGEGKIKPGEGDIDLSNWNQAVEELRGQEFQSFDAAVQAVAERVLRDLEVNEAEKKQLLSFVEDLFELDPIAADHLRSSLRIQQG